MRTYEVRPRPLNPKRSKPANAKWIFHGAESYNKGADTLKSVRRENVHGKDIGDLALSSLVLESLAAELYLKSLLAEELGTIPMTHDLYELFRKLPRNTKETLKRRHTELASKDAALMWLREGEFVFSLEELLRLNKDAFEQYRYLHEGKAKSEFLLTVFIKCAREYILERHPEWER